MTELAGKLVVIKVSGDPLDLAGEVLAHIDDHTWQVDAAAKRVIDPAVAPVLELYDGANWNEISYLSVNRLSGTFKFDGDGYVSTEDIRVKSGNYLPMSTAATAHSYSYNRGVDLFEVNRFGINHKKRIKGTKFANGTINQWDVIDSYFEDALTNGDVVVMEFKPEEAAAPQRLWALVESDEMSAAIDSAQDRAVSFISTDELLNII